MLAVTCIAQNIENDTILNSRYYSKLNNYQKANYLISTSMYRLERLNNNVFHLLDSAGKIIKLNKYKDLEFDLYMCNGLYWKYAKEFANSVQYYLFALDKVRNKDDLKTVIAYISLGEAYRAAADKINSLKYFYKAEFLLNQSSINPKLLAKIYNRLGASYFQFADFGNKLANRGTSKTYLEKSIGLLLDNADYNVLLDSYITLGAIYRDWKDSIEATNYFDKAEKICDTYPDSSFTIYNYATMMINKAFLLNNFNNMNEAINCIIKLNNFNNQHCITVNNGAIYGILSDIYTKMKNYKIALYYKDLEYHFYIHQNFESKNRAMIELAARYDNTQYEQQLKSIDEVTKYQALAIIIGILLVVISAYMFRSRHNALKKKQEMIELQNKELVILNATKDKFFSILAHDLKNPIFGISTLLEVVQDDVDNDNFQDLKYNISLLNSNSKHVSELLGNLLTWARSQRGLLTHYPISINISYVVNSNIELLNANALNKNITIIDKTNDSHFVTADANMLITIVRNLLSNAIKFTPENGYITINSELTNDEVVTSISDTGIGISEEMIKTIFSIDKSSHRLGTNNESGTGLGLILCHEFISKQNGRIWVESAEKKGTTFYFSLPIATNADQ